MDRSAALDRSAAPALGLVTSWAHRPRACTHASVLSPSICLSHWNCLSLAHAAIHGSWLSAPACSRSIGEWGVER